MCTHSGWLCKRGLSNTALQRRWCAIHDLKLWYYDNPRSDEPKGVVYLKGAIVHRSKKIKLAIEIETGALVMEKGLEKRTYVFTTAGADDASRSSVQNETMKRAQKKRDQEMLEIWLRKLQEEVSCGSVANGVHVRFPACLPDCLSMQTAKTFTPG